MGTKDKLIQIISKESDKVDPYGTYFIEFFDVYGLNSLSAATEEQLREFIEAKFGREKIKNLDFS